LEWFTILAQNPPPLPPNLSDMKACSLFIGEASKPPNFDPFGWATTQYSRKIGQDTKERRRSKQRQNAGEPSKHPIDVSRFCSCT
jgi:hypothetical protein